MRVGIIGAGIAGLSAAYELKKQGADAVVFERAEIVGGRCATERLNGCVFDTGLQTLTPRGMAIEKVLLEELPNDDLILISRGVGVHTGGRIGAGSSDKNRVPRYIYRQGADEFTKLLAAGTDVRTGVAVQALERANGGYKVAGEQVDRVILSAPIPESQRLLATIGLDRGLSNASYRQCLSVSLGFEAPSPDIPYYALLAQERMNPVLWVGIESLKSPDRAPEGHSAFVVQMGPEYSRSNLGAEEEVVTGVALGTLTRLFGEAYGKPKWTYLKRWEFSQPERVALFESANRGAQKVVVCGDATVAGRAENAFESGVMAAKRVLEP